MKLLTANIDQWRTLNKLLSVRRRILVRSFLHNKPKYLSKMFQKFTDLPKQGEITSISHRLFLANGIYYPSSLGVFTLMPQGLRALQKLIKIIDQEMEAIGAEKIQMPSLVPKRLWKTTGRWDAMGAELFRLEDRHKKGYCLGPTHEEIVTELLASQLNFQHRFPTKLYQITKKFRDEPAPHHGFLRSREFEMKDLYTFHTSEEDAKSTYEEVIQAYEKILQRLQLEFVKAEAATGLIGGSQSHEFHLKCPGVGEDLVYTCTSCGYSGNKEVLEKEDECSSCKSNRLESFNAIEVGHAFLLGQKYSKPLGAMYRAEDQKMKVLEMGCYGMGVSRLLQASVEVQSDGKHIKWPRLIAPYQIVIIPQKKGASDDEFRKLTELLYEQLQYIPSTAGEVIIDDRLSITIGRRIVDARCQGFPYAVVIGNKAIEREDGLEVIDIYSDNESITNLTIAQVADYFSKK
ncbi:probable proline--tRNA ligase, mitochondrial [Saccostrea echinata]|uniref:probable proline--tRNA ligase, mitochondrial n=1 Tax=Saccostrea echinata TaxID=191078 RepID=UPI002A81ACCE|nr:probable proline--tRNA ligase, mitochondrial [Saccostrea echinata]